MKKVICDELYDLYLFCSARCDITILFCCFSLFVTCLFFVCNLICASLSNIASARLLQLLYSQQLDLAFLHSIVKSHSKLSQQL